MVIYTYACAVKFERGAYIPTTCFSSKNVVLAVDGAENVPTFLTSEFDPPGPIYRDVDIPALFCRRAAERPSAHVRDRAHTYAASTLCA